jgi:tRNA nucleotidyltransferase (CCA-adding enzyme)
MGKAGKLSGLNSERIWKELSRALMEPHPRMFFDTLLKTDALKFIFPDIYRLVKSLEAFRWHPEGNAYEHSMLVLTQAARMEYDLETRFACLVHDIGKGITPAHLQPSHFGHDVNGVPLVENFGEMYAVPKALIETAKKATRYHMMLHDLPNKNPKTVAKMFVAMDILRNKRAIKVLYEVGICDHRGRLGSENAPVDNADILLTLGEAFSSVKFGDVIEIGETRGHVIEQKMLKARINAVSKVMGK